MPDFSNHGDWEAFRFTPDGNLVFLQGDFRYQNFWLANLTTGEKRQLTNLKPGYSVRAFDISPDGKEILYDRGTGEFRHRVDRFATMTPLP